MERGYIRKVSRCEFEMRVSRLKIFNKLEKRSQNSAQVYENRQPDLWLTAKEATTPVSIMHPAFRVDGGAPNPRIRSSPQSKVKYEQ
jgi:hypothetical protein